MNWIILIITGFFETGFVFCLGKLKGLSGVEWYLWGTGFLACLALGMALLAKAVHTVIHKHANHLNRWIKNDKITTIKASMFVNNILKRKQKAF